MLCAWMAQELTAGRYLGALRFKQPKHTIKTPQQAKEGIDK
jgi:hypothetical protein